MKSAVQVKEKKNILKMTRITKISRNILIARFIFRLCYNTRTHTRAHTRTHTHARAYTYMYTVMHALYILSIV